MSIGELGIKVETATVEAREPLGGLTKRLFDIVASATLLLLFAPLMLLISVAVRLTDRGPAMYAHERIGFGGKKFRCLKFRSMNVNSAEILARLLADDEQARAEWAANQKLRNDPRITQIGRLLRESSLDELPQLINVLRGDMSLVGPRPIVDAEQAHYGNNIAFYRRARPGITGLWQVSGRSDCTYNERVGYDVAYTSRWSIFEDIKILLRTVVVVLRRTGSR